MRALVALPYANPHLGLFYQWVQSKFDCDFYVFGDVQQHRSNIQIEQYPMQSIDRSTASNNVRSGLYTAVFMHGMFYPETLFLLSAKSTRVIILTEPIAPGKRSFLTRLYKKLISKWLTKRHDVSLLLLGPLMAKDAFEQLAGKKIYSTAYGYFPITGQHLNRKAPQVQPVEVVFAGQLIERKNIDLILQAAQLSSSVRNGQCRITIAGDGPLKDAVQASPHVTYYGLADRTALLELFSKSDILLLPSKYDGWGAVVNEAAACGCMVLLGQHVMASALFLKENETGLFASADAQALAAQLDALCSNPDYISKMKSGMQKHYSILLQTHDSLLENHFAHATTTAYL